MSASVYRKAVFEMITFAGLERRADSKALPKEDSKHMLANTFRWLM